jgi:pimeloyl-ACP methyl ester carboxylesterase
MADHLSGAAKLAICPSVDAHREGPMFSCPSCPLSFGLVVVIWAAAATATEPAAKEVEANGITMHYLDEGTGEPVVLVHGAVSDVRAWEPIRAEITDRYRFIAPTLRYFGTGDWPDQGEKFGIETHADDVAAFIRALDLGPVHLVGWSYGANVATAIALADPDAVQSLVLFEPHLPSLIREGDAGDAAREAMGQMFGPVTVAVEAGDAEKATELLIEGVFQMPPGGFTGQPQEFRAMQIDNARTIPLLWSASPWEVTCDMLKGLDRPVLIVHGAKSNAYWPHIAEVMDECLPQAEVAAQPDVNHDGPVRDPAGFATMIEGFVAKH